MFTSFVTPWTVARQASLSMGFPRQEYWSGLQFHSAGDLPNRGMEPMSPAVAGRFFTTEPPGKPLADNCFTIKCTLKRHAKGLIFTAQLL